MPTDEHNTDAPRVVIVSYDACDNAAVALRSCIRWIDLATSVKSPVTRAVIANAQLALTNLTAAIRLAERTENGFGPQTPGQVHAWYGCEEVLSEHAKRWRWKDAQLLSVTRAAFAALPENWGEYTVAQSASWARQFLIMSATAHATGATGGRGPQPGMTWLEPDPTDLEADRLEALREDEAHRKGERLP